MPAGRPTDLTPQVIEDVRRLLPTALYVETVADYLGITRFSFRNWLRRGAKEAKRLRRNHRSRVKIREQVYLEFFNVYKKALAEGELYSTGTIKKAAIEQWQAAAWLLERRSPEKWGRKDRVEHSGAIDQTKTVKHEYDITVRIEQLMSEYDALAARQAPALGNGKNGNGQFLDSPHAEH